MCVCACVFSLRTRLRKRTGKHVVCTCARICVFTVRLGDIACVTVSGRLELRRPVIRISSFGNPSAAVTHRFCLNTAALPPPTIASAEPAAGSPLAPHASYRHTHTHNLQLAPGCLPARVILSPSHPSLLRQEVVALVAQAA